MPLSLCVPGSNCWQLRTDNAGNIIRLDFRPNFAAQLKLCAFCGLFFCRGSYIHLFWGIFLYEGRLLSCFGSTCHCPSRSANLSRVQPLISRLAWTNMRSNKSEDRIVNTLPEVRDKEIIQSSMSNDITYIRIIYISKDKEIEIK